jgi:hypothetical protein
VDVKLDAALRACTLYLLHRDADTRIARIPDGQAWAHGEHFPSRDEEHSTGKSTPNLPRAGCKGNSGLTAGEAGTTVSHGRRPRPVRLLGSTTEPLVTLGHGICDMAASRRSAGCDRVPGGLGSWRLLRGAGGGRRRTGQGAKSRRGGARAFVLPMRNLIQLQRTNRG